MQVKVWLLGISPMVWRHVLVRDTCSLRELHGVIQVAMGWEGHHLYLFRLHSKRYGFCEVSASSPDVTLAALKLRRGARLVYEHLGKFARQPMSLRFTSGRMRAV